MKKLFVLMLALVLAAGFATAMAQNDDAAVRQRINEAVLKVYDEQLAKEPNDYSTLLARANQYYYFGRVDDAMTDVNSALALIPTKEKEMRYDALMLRARLFDQQGAFEGEIADLTEAANLVPSSLACTDMLAKVCLKVFGLNGEKSLVVSAGHIVMSQLGVTERAEIHSRQILIVLFQHLAIFINSIIVLTQIDVSLSLFQSQVDAIGTLVQLLNKHRYRVAPLFGRLGCCAHRHKNGRYQYNFTHS